MSDLPAIRRELQIKTGVVKRLKKEHQMYTTEAEAQKRKLDKLVADGVEGWDIRNGTRMMEESNKMITDSASRLGKAVGELRDLVVSARKVTALAEDERLLEAIQVQGEVQV